MTEAYDGRQVVGMDLHRRRSVLVRMTEDGRRLETARITNSAAELRRQIAKAGQHPKVVLEATYGWYWAADELAAAGAEVHLAHPLGVKAFSYRRVKNDEKDAGDLADLLRMGRLPEAWIAPPEVRELRELTRYRIKLVRLRSSGKAQVHAVLAKLGIPVTCSDLFGTWGSAWLDGLAPGDRPPGCAVRPPVPHRGDLLMRLIGADLPLAPLDQLLQLRQELIDHPRPARRPGGHRPAPLTRGHIPRDRVVGAARQLGGVPQRPRQVVGLQNVHDLLGRLHSSPPGN